MELRILPSDEGFQEISELSHMIAIAKNPHMWYNAYEQIEEDGDVHRELVIDPIEQNAIISTLEYEFEKLAKQIIG